MKRRLFNAAALISLVLCLMAAGLWVWTGLISGPIFFQASGPARIGLEGMVGGNSIIIQITRDRPSGTWTDQMYGERYFGFRLSAEGSATQRSIGGVIPLWFVIALFALPCVVWRWRNRGRSVKASTCPACGYDLRGSAEKCPECGAAISAKSI
jgi:hypothetical protein